MKRIAIYLFLLQLTLNSFGQIIIDHNCRNLQSIPAFFIEQAKSSLHIAYEHTSHGSQIIDGMTGLYNWKGSAYAWNNGGSNGALDIDDHGITGGSDLGSPDWTSWAASTRSYLRDPANSNINVVMWAWCTQVSSATEENINTYLSLMSSLETEFPGVKFVYMTGHLDGTGINGNLHQRNEQIRNYCKNNKKILYDFADIESYDPDGNYFLSKGANDNCDYDSNGDGVTDRNWAIDWQNTHILNTDWYDCTSAHSQPLNANLKAYAAWWLWARLAGWSGPSGTVPVTGITVSGAGGVTTINTNKGTLQLTAAVSPSNATNKTVTWSIINVTGQATISSAGLVQAIADGTVTARATANDGSGVTGSLSITISNQIVLVKSITVTGAKGSTVINTDDGSLQLTAFIEPLNASNKSVTWSVVFGSGQASISPTGLVTAISNGTVTAVATANDGSGVKGQIVITISNQMIPVEAIIIKTEDGSTTVPESKVSLQLKADIVPEIATNKDVIWEVINLSGKALIDKNGLLIPVSEGTVKVVAVATDGSGTTGSLEITIRRKYPDHIIPYFIGSELTITIGDEYFNSKLSLFDINGRMIFSESVKSDIIVFDSSRLKPGIYILVLSNSTIVKTGKVIIR